MKIAWAFVVAVAAAACSGCGTIGGAAQRPGRELGAPSYDSTDRAPAPGVALDAGLAAVRWTSDAGRASDTVPALRATVFYRLEDRLDLCLSAQHVAARADTDGGGVNRLEATTADVGIKYWFPSGRPVRCYLGGGVGYTVWDAPADADGAPGTFVEAGSALRLSNRLFVQAGVGYDLLLDGADFGGADGRGRDELERAQATFQIGLAWTF